MSEPKPFIAGDLVFYHAPLMITSKRHIYQFLHWDDGPKTIASLWYNFTVYPKVCVDNYSKLTDEHVVKFETPGTIDSLNSLDNRIKGHFLPEMEKFNGQTYKVKQFDTIMIEDMEKTVIYLDGLSVFNHPEWLSVELNGNADISPEEAYRRQRDENLRSMFT